MLSMRRLATLRPSAAAMAVPVRSMAGTTIYWTETDEAPALASRALLPIVQAFTQPAGIDVVKVGRVSRFGGGSHYLSLR